jgi:ABC-type Na+ efflux pump permease subunit
MLNNDFQVLVGKYKRYKKQQKNRRMLKFLLLIPILLLAYLLFDALKTTTSNVHTTQSNQTKESLAQPNEQKIEQKKESDLNQSEINHSTNENINQHRLQVTTQASSLEQLTKNQEKYKNYSSTIALANYHFSKKEYKEAVKWSIAASKKNNSKVRPWIVYAKSKLADGKVDIAKKALELYLKKYKSKEAQDLLDKLNAI